MVLIPYPVSAYSLQLQIASRLLTSYDRPQYGSRLHGCCTSRLDKWACPSKQNDTEVSLLKKSAEVAAGAGVQGIES